MTMDDTARQEGAQPDNANAMRFKTPEERRGLCQSFCEHKRAGFSDSSFPDCDIDTLKSYISKFPDDFPDETIAKARREGRLKWEKIGMEGTQGMPKMLKDKDGNGKPIYGRFNSQSYAFLMQNMFNWKLRTDVTSDDRKIEGPILYIPEEVKG